MMVVLAQRVHWLCMAAKLEFDIAVYPWPDRAPEFHLPVAAV